MVEFTCKYCNYKLRPKKELQETPKKCPYCGKEGFMENTSRMVKNILSEAGVK